MMIYKNFINLLKKLKVKNPNKTSMMLLSDDYAFYNKYGRESETQYGSGKPEKLMYKFKGYKFVIYQDISKDRITFSIHDNNNLDKNTCLMLIITKNDKKENYVYLQNISVLPNCVIGGMPKTKAGTLLMHMALDFIESIKNKYKLKYIQLKDNSFFYCEQTKRNIDFDSLYMLTRGDTWYGKYGFIPYDSMKDETDEQQMEFYKSNQNLVNNILVKNTKIQEYFEKAIKILKLENLHTREKINELFNIYKNKPISKFFRDLLKINYNGTCGIFELIYKKVMNNVGLYDLHGKSYYKRLN